MGCDDVDRWRTSQKPCDLPHR